MSSGGLLLLLGLLTLWEGLTPVSSKNRPHICHLPANPGLCNGKFQAFYYNRIQRSCLMFMYGGCGGNANNFKTIDECKQTCVV
uniref:KP-Ver-5 n=1 Tax=Vermicella annulata TaxID=1295044 RepID=R4G348_9SAUR